MKLIHSNHLIGYVETDQRCNQWIMNVYNNGVCLGVSYGNLPIPSDDALQKKITAVADHLPVNLWSA